MRQSVPELRADFFEFSCQNQAMVPVRLSVKMRCKKYYFAKKGNKRNNNSVTP
jgi:hypothetical protein